MNKKAQMDFLEQMNRNAEATLKKANKNAEKTLERANRNASKSIGMDIKRERKSVSSKLRKKVLEENRYKCKDCPEKDKDLLEIHHIDMNNTHTYPSNLVPLCPTCHAKRHKKEFRKRYVSRDMLGRTSVRTRLVTKEKNKELNKRKRVAKTRNRNYPFNFKPQKISFGI